MKAGDLRDSYPIEDNPSFAPGTYVWERRDPRVAVFDSADGSLTFSDDRTHADGQVIDTKTYYTGFEDKAHSYALQPSWLTHAADIKKVDFQADVAPRSCAFWFYGCKNLEEVLGAGRLDTSGAASTEGMFSGCSSLATLDVSKWDTSKVTNMAGMFKDCSSLASLDLSGWNTSKAESMANTFSGCTKLSSVKLGERFTFKARSGASYDAALPDAPAGKGHTGKWANASAPSAAGVTAAELRDRYLDSADPRFASGTYVWETTVDISAAKVTAPDRVYTGAALEPAPTVALNGKTLVAGADYTVSYKNNVNAGTATVVVIGKGNYEGSASGSFRINAADISKAAVTLAQASFTYDGKAKKLAVKSVALGGKVLAAGIDYDVSYSSNVNAGTATAIVMGKGNYTGTAKATFAIKKASIAKAKVKLAKKSYRYDGKAKKPKVKSVKLNGKKLKASRDYKVSYKKNKKPGKATVIVTGKGNYQGTVKVKFTIKKA